MSGQISTTDPGQGFKGGRDFMQTGNIRSDALTVVDSVDSTKALVFNLANSATATTTTVKANGGTLGLQATSHASALTHVGLGTVSNPYINLMVVGNVLFGWGKVTAGTVTGVSQKITLPVAYTIDTTNLPATNYVCGSISNYHLAATTRGDVFFDGTITTDLFVSYASSSGDVAKSLGNAISVSGDTIYFNFAIPVTGY